MNWIESYRSKVRTSEEAVSVIKSNMRVYVHPGCATPEVLLNAMCENSNHFENVEVIHLFYKGILPIDVALINVSPPDKYGFCSFGVGIECTKPATEVAKIIIAQINTQMPRTLGDSFIHIDKIDYCVEVDAPLNELRREEKNN